MYKLFNIDFLALGSYRDLSGMFPVLRSSFDIDVFMQDESKNIVFLIVTWCSDAPESRALALHL